MKYLRAKADLMRKTFRKNAVDQFIKKKRYSSFIYPMIPMIFSGLAIGQASQQICRREYFEQAKAIQIEEQKKDVPKITNFIFLYQKNKKQQLASNYNYNQRLNKNGELLQYNTPYDPSLITLKKKYQFRIEDLISQGSFSKVYKGYTLHNKSVVAIKQTHFSHKKQFIREIQSFNKIRSEYIVKVIDFEVTTNKGYLIMEYCQQGSLQNIYKNLLPQEGNLLQQAQILIVQIIQGMKQLYHNKIIHRDLKLQNILVKNGKAKISDFGLARSMADRSIVQSIKCGTPCTMAPEIYFTEYKPFYDQKCDIYSLGVVAHQLVYKVHPFGNQKAFIKQKRVQVTKIYPVQQLIEGCLKFKKQERMNWEQVFEMSIKLKRNLRIYECVQQEQEKIKMKPLFLTVIIWLIIVLTFYIKQIF